MSTIFKSMLTSFNGTSDVRSDIKPQTLEIIDHRNSTKAQLFPICEPTGNGNGDEKELQLNSQSTKNKSGKLKLMSKMMARLSQVKSKEKNISENNNAKQSICQQQKKMNDLSSPNGNLSINLGEKIPYNSNGLNHSIQEEEEEDNQEEDDDDEEIDDDKENIALPEEQCDLPSFLETKNCDSCLIEETRRLLRERYAKNPDSFYRHDYERMLQDDWTVTRFLLRRRLDPKRTAKLMEECGSFRKLYKMSEVKLWEFPIEFHQVGGLFHYEPDKVGNITVYMRTRMYRRVPELSDVFKAFVLCVLEEADCANQGRGVAVIFDLTGCGLQNVDLGFLSWLLSSFRNYCPKGVSYIMVYNLPWFLNATAKLAMSWLSSSNRRVLRFVHGKEIESFIARENLPDYLGGTCKRDYRQIPEGSKPAVEVCDRLDMSPEQALKIRDIFTEYLPDDEKLTKEQKAKHRSNNKSLWAGNNDKSQKLVHSKGDNCDAIKSDQEDEEDDDEFVDAEQLINSNPNYLIKDKHETHSAPPPLKPTKTSLTPINSNNKLKKNKSWLL